jgi:hypothetical protein
MTVIPFKRSTSGRLGGRKVEPPAALGGAKSASGEAELPDEVDYRLRAQQNFAALAVVIVIVVLGTWMIDELRTYSRIRACFDAGHRNCMPLKIDPPTARY